MKARLEEFALEVLKQWHNNGERGDVDGSWLQEIAVKTGCAVEALRKTPCSPEGCPCSEYSGTSEIVMCIPLHPDVFRLMYPGIT